MNLKQPLVLSIITTLFLFACKKSPQPVITHEPDMVLYQKNYQHLLDSIAQQKYTDYLKSLPKDIYMVSGGGTYNHGGYGFNYYHPFTNDSLIVYKAGADSIIVSFRANEEDIGGYDYSTAAGPVGIAAYPPSTQYYKYSYNLYQQRYWASASLSKTNDSIYFSFSTNSNEIFSDLETDVSGVKAH